MIHCEINVKLVFHEILWKKNFTVYPFLYSISIVKFDHVIAGCCTMSSNSQNEKPLTRNWIAADIQIKEVLL